MLIRHMYMKLTVHVSRTAALKMITIQVIQFQSGTSKLLFVKKLTEENSYITIREIYDFSIGTAERIVPDVLNLKKIVERWIPYLQTDQQKS